MAAAQSVIRIDLVVKGDAAEAHDEVLRRMAEWVREHKCTKGSGYPVGALLYYHVLDAHILASTKAVA